MSEVRLYTFCECPHCHEPVRASRHSVEECRETVVRQRDEARAAAIDFYEDLVYMDAYLFFKWHRGDSDRLPWLKGHEPFPQSEDHYRPKEDKGE